MAIRQRRMEADYLKVGENFEFLGAGFTAIDEKPNSQVTEKRYINDASSSQSVTGYKWQADFSGDQIDSEKAIEHVESDKVAYIPALPMHRKHIITLGDGDDD